MGRTYLTPELQQAIVRDLDMRFRIMAFMSERKVEYLGAIHGVSASTVRRIYRGQVVVAGVDNDTLKRRMVEAKAMEPLMRQFTINAIANRHGVGRRTVEMYARRLRTGKALPRPTWNQI